MKISTRTRYGLRLLVHLASQPPGALVNVKDAAQHEGVSAKYLEQIIRSLKKAGMLSVVRGAHGGYSVGRDPETITALEIVEVLEDGNLLMDCLDGKYACDRIETCSALDFWREFRGVVADYLQGITLAELVRRDREKGAALMFYI